MVINSDAGAAYAYAEHEKRESEVKSVQALPAQVKADGYTPTAVRIDNDKSKYVNLPTKKYIDSMIKSAVQNIERGINVDENKRIINIFSNIINENPRETANISYRI